MTFAKAVVAPEPRNDLVKKGAWVYAALLVLLAIGQLYAFEKFIPLIQAYGLPGGQGATTVFAAVIVVAEVFALPFLLRMPLSPLMRLMSAFFGVLVPAIWLVLSLIALINGGIENGGILGAKVTVGATTQAIIALVLTALAGWSLWGLSLRKKI